MSRKRAEKKSKKSYSKHNSKIIPTLLIIILLLIVGVTTILYIPLKEEPKEETNDSDGKWLFAMDTANIAYKYSVSGIPTLVVINKDGNIAYYSSGAHSKEQLMPYIDSALEGTSENLAVAPDFTVTTFNNIEFTLSDYTGEVIILDIMGVGCIPCVMQMPELQKIKEEKGEKVIILSIDTYYSGETKQDVIDTYGEYIKL